MRSWIEPYCRSRNGKLQHVHGHWRRDHEEIKQSETILDQGREEGATELGSRNLPPIPQRKVERIQKAMVAARLVVDSFLDWMVVHSVYIGHVFAHLGLATAITVAITYVCGVNPTTTFLVATAALTGKNIWDVIKLFASKKE